VKRRWDFCWGCGAFTSFRCARCGHPVCVVVCSPIPGAGCARLRKAPRKVGVYLLVCSPRCRLRRSPHVLALINRGPQD
jgi:hypothetical protein